ncbi:hypothetical protein [Myxococcus xanthus]|uniref:hypothetical protein n=1 Tax=Myxococcus xanthus TaxID=34 RepID=UPI001125DDEA|nr:hypothetical protein [Myxococcus xanthus]
MRPRLPGARLEVPAQAQLLVDGVRVHHFARVHLPLRIPDALELAELEAYTDPGVAPLPPHITFEQARHFASALLEGDEDTAGVIKQSLKGMVDKLLPHKG